MDNILGIPIRRKLTDAQYVERIRRNLHLSRKVVWIHVLVLAAVCYFIPKFYNFLSDLIEAFPSQEQKIVWGTALVGAMFGAMFGFIVFKEVEAVLMSLAMDRTSTLLVKYYDLLKLYAPKQMECEPRRP